MNQSTSSLTGKDFQVVNQQSLTPKMDKCGLCCQILRHERQQEDLKWRWKIKTNNNSSRPGSKKEIIKESWNGSAIVG